MHPSFEYLLVYKPKTSLETVVLKAALFSCDLAYVSEGLFCFCALPSEKGAGQQGALLQGVRGGKTILLSLQIGVQKF